MPVDEFFKFINEVILTKHSFFPLRGKCIKYIRPHIDTRTREVYGVVFSCLGAENKEFFVVNENRHRNLKEWIEEWLVGKTG